MSTALQELVPGATSRPGIPGDPKIKPRHLALGVLIYVRQSSPTQIYRHPEGAKRQYGLAERAKQLGWAEEQITIIDGDQGKSGAAAPRPTIGTASPNWSRRSGWGRWA